MKQGDVFPYHYRGSKYVFSMDKIFYKTSTGNRFYVKSDYGDLIEKLKDVRGNSSGRFRITEEREIITYKKQDSRFIPVYVGEYDYDFIFEDFDNNPVDLEIGVLWTGFNREHGSKLNIGLDERVFFKETQSDEYSKSTTKYFVTNLDKTLVDLILVYKKHAGSFRINEHRHLFTSITRENLDLCYKEGLIERDTIQENFTKLSKAQKNMILRYVEPYENRFTGKKTTWFPIYLGQYLKKLEIKRKNEPKILDYTPYDDYDV